MDIIYINYGILIFTILSIIFLIRILQKINSDKLIISMVSLSLLLMINVFIFSTVRIVDQIDGIIMGGGVYNYWSLLIRMENVVSMAWISFIAYRRMRGK